MTKQPARRYVGGVALDMVLPSDREITVQPGDVIRLLASEVDAIDARPDFEPADKPANQPADQPAED